MRLSFSFLYKLQPDLDKEFRKFYESNLKIQANGTPLVINLNPEFSAEFEARSHDFFSKHADAHKLIDLYFNNFHPIWRTYLDAGHFKAAERLWDNVLNIVTKWETNRQKIHKGTPFYWLAGTAILNGELDKGFAIMHQALKEDIRTLKTETPKTPAFFFVILDFGATQQYFRNIVLEASNFLEGKINHYLTYMHNKGGSNLNLPNFKSKFLEHTNILEIVFYFVHTLFKARHIILDIKREWRQNAFCSLMETGMIFDLCLIIEEVIKEKDDTNYRNNIAYFSNRIVFLSQKAHLALNSSRLKQIRKDLDTDFAGVLNMLLNSTYGLTKGMEEDLAIAYAFRNFAAHSLESLKLVYEKFEDILQRILNALFFSIGVLY